MTREEVLTWPEGTKVVIEDRENADGTFTPLAGQRRILFPDGTGKTLPPLEGQ